MHRIPRLALLIGGIASAQFAVGSASAQSPDPNRPGTPVDRDRRTGQTGEDTGPSGQSQTGKYGTDKGTQTGAMNRMGGDEDKMKYLDRDMTDSELVNKIHALNLHEIDMGKLAQTNATNKDVRTFAEKIVKDHQDADKKLTDVAKKMGIEIKSLSDTMDTEHQAKMQSKMDELKGMSGIDFDRHFLMTMQKGHDDAALLLTAQGFAHPVGKDLRDFIKKSLPQFNDHRKRAIDLLEKISDKTPPTS